MTKRLLIDGRILSGSVRGVGALMRKLIPATASAAAEAGWHVDVASYADKVRETELFFPGTPVDIRPVTRRLPFASISLPALTATRSSSVVLLPRQTYPLFVRAPVVTVLYDVGFFVQRAAYERNIRRDVITLLALRKSAEILAISATSARDAARYASRPPVVLPLGSSDQYDWAPGNDRFVLCVAAHFPNKNLASLIEAWAIAQLDGVRLVIAGPYGPETPRLRRLVEKLHCGTSVTLTGHVPEEQLAELFSRCWAYVQPSYYEGLCLPLLSAIASGIPSVGARAGHLEQLFGSLPLQRFEPFDVHEIARSLRRVVEDNDFRAVCSSSSLVHQTDWAEAAAVAFSAIAHSAR